METVETTMIENMRKLDQSVPPNKKLGFSDANKSSIAALSN
jgi:hypothetical protein